MGGYFALRAIIDHPERISALILSDTQCVADTPEGRVSVTSIENIKKQGVEEYAAQSIGNLLAPDTLTTKPANVTRIRDMTLGTSDRQAHTFRGNSNFALSNVSDEIFLSQVQRP